MHDDSTPHDLRRLEDALLEGIRALEPSAREGAVRGRQPPPYRRVDCDGRALAYLRPRRRGARGVRIDLSGLWVRPRGSPLEIHGRSGSASLLVTQPEHVEEAARFIAEAVTHTRRLLTEEARRGRASIAPARYAPGRTDSAAHRP